MSSVKAKIILSALGEYVKKNKKVVIFALVAFALGIALGAALACRAVDGEFERVPQVDAETGSWKVFFVSSISLCGCYAVALIAGVRKKAALLICVPYIVLGLVFGRYAVALIARYEGFGALNLIFVYMPFFLCSAVLLLVACALNLNADCEACGCSGALRPTLVRTLKILGINVALSFVFMIVIGGICGGVIIVKLF